MSAKAERLKVKAVAVYEALPPNLKRFLKQSQDKGASSWVNCIPLEDEGFNVSEEKFRSFIEDKVQPSPPTPTSNLCLQCMGQVVWVDCSSQPNNLAHALQCQKGGFVNHVDTITSDTF